MSDTLPRARGARDATPRLPVGAWYVPAGSGGREGGDRQPPRGGEPRGAPPSAARAHLSRREGCARAMEMWKGGQGRARRAPMPCSSETTSQNLAPIWLPHWPPWTATISRMSAVDVLEQPTRGCRKPKRPVGRIYTLRCKSAALQTNAHRLLVEWQRRQPCVVPDRPKRPSGAAPRD